jgi:hypothetical protein
MHKIKSECFENEPKASEPATDQPSHPPGIESHRRNKNQFTEITLMSDFTTPHSESLVEVQIDDTVLIDVEASTLTVRPPKRSEPEIARKKATYRSLLS